MRSSGLLVAAVTALCSAAAESSSSRSQHRLFSTAFGYPGVNSTYDYVVVGGGTAGLTLARRLAAHASVAIIEAGGFYEVETGNASVVPLLSLTGLAFLDPAETFLPQPLADWSLVTEPVVGAAGRRIHYAQGKTLGGSSAINTMSYIRSTRGAYERWAEIVGDDSYEWDAMLPFLKRSVHLTPPDLAKRNSTAAPVVYDRSAFDPAGGPMQVSWNNWVDPTLAWMAKAVGQAGLPLSDEGFVSGSLVGQGAWVPSTIDPERATRSSAETSFLREAIEETNLIVYTHTLAKNILFDTASLPKATGVSVNTAGLDYTILARKEVVVSAGVFHSPQLLLVSGVGPVSTLQSLSIPVVADLPGVGQNLWDPIQIFVSYQADTTSGQVLTADPATAPRYLEQYFTDASGPYSSAAGFLAAERVPPSYRSGLRSETLAKLSSWPEDVPELEYITGSFVGPNLTTIATVAVVMPLPFSRGSVTISSRDAADPPVIDLGWFADDADLELALAGLKRLRNDIWNTPVARQHRVGKELLPSPGVQTDKQMREYIRQNASPIWHACSTCAMGKAEDVEEGKAVVDSHGRVFGVDGLRVVDASAFPFSMPGHPQSAVYALAEKIAEDIMKSA